ncbi:hypothetical protein V6N13_074490 [Hibiscus sabdariffa]|uniref:Uncharacterized protein n=1 Tax=Hibiscus sabdariffa TaxID=183260 RepID=A0ABR2U8Y5_9ROSI
MANSASGMAVNDECKMRFLELKAKRNYSLPPNECRYAVYDFDFTTDEIVKRVKFSSLYGHRTHRGRGSKCCMRVPKTGWCFDASEMSFDIVKERAY